MIALFDLFALFAQFAQFALFDLFDLYDFDYGSVYLPFLVKTVNHNYTRWIYIHGMILFQHYTAGASSYFRQIYFLILFDDIQTLYFCLSNKY